MTGGLRVSRRVGPRPRIPLSVTLRLFPAARRIVRWIFREAPVSARLAGRVRAAQLDAAARLAPFSTLVSASVAVVVVASSWCYGPRGYLLAFLVALEVVAAGILVACWQWRQGVGRSSSTPLAVTLAVTAAAALGLIWASIPVVLFAGADPDNRLLIACTCAGLICTGVVVAPLVAAAEAFVLPIILGSFAGLYLTGERFFAIIALLLAIYAVFIVSSIAYLHYTFIQKLLQQFQLEEQGDIIRLLLGDFDQSASDWLWETDAAGRLRNVSQRFAQVLNRRPSEADGVPFLNAIFGPGASPVLPSPERQKLANCFAEQVFFRDVAVPVQVGSEDRWWSLTGKAIFDVGGQFQGYRGVGSDITAVRAAESRIAHQARHDFLTGLPNRILFLEAVRSACEAVASCGRPFALFLLDLDGFKAVNDRLGHPAGDELLRAVARRLAGSVREGDLIARLGGDEFTVLLADATVDTAAALAQRIIARLSTPFSVDGVEAIVGASIGIALAPSAGEQADELLRHADMALYSAKATGRGRYRFFGLELESTIRERRSLLADLREACRRGELQLFYQPIVSAQTLAVRGFEALLRWEHPQRGLVLPDQIIRLAEEAGLVGDIGAWVLHQACSEAVGWPAGLRVAVNVSAAQFRDTSLIGLVHDALAAAGMPASRLELEITESVLMEAAMPTVEVLRQLRASGVRVALDDFGTGFSSLGYLRNLPFDKIKIDGSFVRDMSSEGRGAAIVHTIIGLAASLGVATTAEGVETIEHFLPLRAQGCTEVQGFLFSRPLPSAEIPAFLQTPRLMVVPEMPTALVPASLSSPPGRVGS
ncbi:MAG TPA: EAL domain-containing protein [Acetobacteraceae bacterium]|nr:EAL domain-containing protein [Acetobacteraceae bacterium]